MYMQRKSDTVVEIGEFRVRIGTQLDDKVLSILNGRALETVNGRSTTAPLAGTFTAKGNKLFFESTDRLDWPDCVRQLQLVMSYMFGSEAVAYQDERDDEYVMEANGSTWCSYSSMSGLQYSGPSDYVGMYRE